MSAIDALFAEGTPLQAPESPGPSGNQAVARVGMALILLLALAARLAILWKYGGQLANDPDLYREIAQHILFGEGFATDRGLTAYRPPLYPALLAGILKATANPFAIGLVQAVLGVITTALTIRIGYRLGLRHAALLAGLLVAVDPLLLQATTQVMTEALATLLAAWILFALMRSQDRWGAGEAFLDGLPIGLAILCRPTFAAFFLCWLAGAVLLALRRAQRSFDPGTWRGNLFVLFCAVLGVAVATAPWGWRNWITFGRYDVLTTHGGYTLLLGHNPVYYDEVVRKPWGAVWGPSLLEWQSGLESELARENPPLNLQPGRPVDEFARDRWMQHKAIETIRNDPAMSVRSGLTLLGRFWNVLPLGGESLPHGVRWGIAAFYGVTLLAAVVGLVRLTRAEWPVWWPAAAMILSFTLVHSVYWADMRMRAPLVPSLALLAARAVSARK